MQAPAASLSVSLPLQAITTVGLRPWAGYGVIHEFRSPRPHSEHVVHRLPTTGPTGASLLELDWPGNAAGQDGQAVGIELDREVGRAERPALDGQVQADHDANSRRSPVATS